MRRADRLFQLVQLLRGRRIVTAAELAEELEVSLRTIYRDVRDLVASGVPIEGEAGVGYCLPRGFDLPPLMFDQEEVELFVPLRLPDEIRANLESFMHKVWHAQGVACTRCGTAASAEPGHARQAPASPSYPPSTFFTAVATSATSSSDSPGDSGRLTVRRPMSAAIGYSSGAQPKRSR